MRLVLRFLVSAAALFPATYALSIIAGDVLLGRDFYSFWPALAATVFTIFFVLIILLGYRLPDEKRWAWAVVALIAHIIAIPVYWYIYLWKEYRTDQAARSDEEDGYRPRPLHSQKETAILVGLLSLWPLAYFVSAILGELLFDKQIFTIVGWLSILFVFFFFLFDLALTERVPGPKRRLWAATLFLGNLFVLPIYWYLYWWKSNAAS